MKRYFIGLLFIALNLPIIFAQTTWQVGPNRTYTRPSEVINLVQDGDIVAIDAGEYIGDVGAWYANNITIRGIGGLAHLQAAGNNSQGKAIWVIAGNDYTIENIEFSECSVPDENGAGIRHEGDNLTIRNCYFHDNEEGILTITNNPDSDVLVEFSEFARNSHPNGFAHNIYINKINSFTMRYNYFHGAVEGHNVKSRAAKNFILYNRIMDEKDGAASYQIDLPSGGDAYIVGNIIQQGKNAPNFHVIAYAAEVNTNTAYASNNCFIYNNTFLNERDQVTFVKVFDNITSNVKLFNNVFANSPEARILKVTDGPFASHSSVNFAYADVSDAGFKDWENYDFSLLMDSDLIDSATDPAVDGGDIYPSFHYIHPMDNAVRPKVDALDIGAYEFGENTAMAPQPIISVDGESALCSGETTVLMLTEAYANYQWSTGATTPSILVDATGIYNVTVTDNQNETGSTQIEITQKQNCDSSGNQPDWEVVSTTTGTDHTIILPTTLQSNINGKSLQSGDWIGFFFEDGGVEKVAGFGQWDATKNVAFPVYGDDTTTPKKEGFAIGETFKIRVWSANENQEYAVEYDFTPITGLISHTDTYADKGLSSLQMVATTTVIMDLTPTIEILGAASICENESTRIDAGTGFDNYLWNTGETTHSILITTPGAYSVTVSDNVGNTGNDEVVLLAKENCDDGGGNENETGVVVFKIDTIEQVEGIAFRVPVRVENFNNISGFQYTINTSDYNGNLAITRIETAALVGVIDNINTNQRNVNIAWVNGEGVTIPDSTIIFYVVLESADLLEGCVTLFIDEQFPLEVVNQIDGLLSIVPYIIKQGAICPINKVAVNGRIYLENGTPVRDVLINHNEVAIGTSNSLGLYAIEDVPRNEENIIRPTKDGNPLAGISSLDIVLILRHVTGLTLLDSPYKIIAADVNRSGAITILDAANLSALMVANITEFPEGPTWRFVPANYVFQNPQNPLAEDFPEYLKWNNLSDDVLDANFIGIKLGDLNESSDGRSKQHIGQLDLFTSTKLTKQPQVYTMDITGENFVDLYGFQMELDYSTQAIEILEIVPNALQGIGTFKTNQHLLKRGKLPLMWYHQTATTFEPKTVLFTIKYQLKNTLSEQTYFTLNTNRIDAEAVTDGYETLAIVLTEKEKEVALDKQSLFIPEFNLVANPNPFQEQVQLAFNLTKNSMVQLMIHDLTGRKIVDKLQSFSTGVNNWTLTNDLFKTKGLFLITLKMEEAIHQIKVIRN